MLRSKRSKTRGRQAAARTKAGWQCPECGREFAHRSQYHSCGRFAVEAHLRGRDARVLSLFRRLERMLRAAARGGSFQLSPARTLIGLRGRSTFGSVRVRREWIDVSLLLPRGEPYLDPRAVGFVALGRRFEHVFRFQSLKDLDSRAARWFRQAYAAQRGKHSAV